jgi:hypothetical protein
MIEDLFDLVFQEIKKQEKKIGLPSRDEMSKVVDGMSQIWDKFRNEIHRRLPPVSREGNAIPSLEKLLEKWEPVFVKRWSRLQQAS